MPKVARTPSFVAEFALKADPAQERILGNRFKAAANLYNGVLGQVIKRARRMRADPAWAKAGKMPKNTKDQKQARSKAFSDVAAKHGFREYDIQKYAQEMRDRSWLDHHLGSHDTQTTAKRAFTAVADWVYRGKGFPHHKPQRELVSIEGKSNEAVIRLRQGAVHWNGLKLPLLLDPRDKDGWQEQALACPTKYVRVKRATIKGKTRYSAQLVQAGVAPARGLPRATKGVGGLDFGQTSPPRRRPASLTPSRSATGITA